MLKSCLIHTKLCLKVGNWPFRAFLPWSVPSHSMPVTPPYARSDGLSCDEGELCWNEASGVGVGLRGERVHERFSTGCRTSARKASRPCVPSRTKPTAQARQLADALAGAQAVRDNFASGLWSWSPMRELIRRRFEHQLALVIHVVQLTDTRAQKVSYQGSISWLLEVFSLCGADPPPRADAQAARFVKKLSNDNLTINKETQSMAG
jgi:hypothetical protein